MHHVEREMFYGVGVGVRSGRATHAKVGARQKFLSSLI